MLFQMDKDITVEYKTLGTLIITYIGLFFIYTFTYWKQRTEQKKKTIFYEVLNSRELSRYPIHKYLYTFLQENKIKNNYLKQSLELKDTFHIPQKELENGVYNKETEHIHFNNNKGQHDASSIIIKVIKKSSFDIDTYPNKKSDSIIERLNKGYLIPSLQFSKPSLLSNIVGEEVLQEINHYIQRHYNSPNEQLNSVINIAKAVEYFILKGVPFASLRIYWNHSSYLSLLEKIGNVLEDKKFKITIELKTFDVSYLDISIKMKTSIFNYIGTKKMNPLDISITKEFIDYFQKHPLFDVQLATNDPAIGLASPYSKLIVKTIPKDLHDEFTYHITANKNGIAYQVLKNHPDFEAFLRKNFIHRYLYTYRHSLYVDQASQPEKIYIKYKGQMKNWKDIKDQLKYREDGVTITGRYSQQGLVDDNVFNWKELTSFICRNENEEIIKVNSQKSTIDNDRDYSHDDEHTLIEYKSIDSRESSDVEDQQTLDSEDSDSDNSSENESMNNESTFQSILSMIKDYKGRYQVFSDIYKDTFQQNSKENVEKFLYYDTRINKSKDPYEHTWGNRYLLEYCFWIVSQPRLSGDHAFIKLKTPEGKVYSVGLYREFKSSLFDSFIFPLRIKPCKFISPDLSEYWKGYYNSIAIEITKEQFEKIKAKVDSDQKIIDHRPYQHIRSNCVTWTQEIAALANVYFPCDYPMTKLLFKNHHLHNFMRKIFRSTLLNPYYILINKIWAFIINFLSILLGARRIDKRVKKNDDYVIEPFYKKISDLCNIDKVILMHPFIMGYHVYNYISDWRLKQTLSLEEKFQCTLDRLKKLKEEDANGNKETIKQCENDIKEIEKSLEDLPYRIPEKFRRKQELPEGELYTKCPILDE